MKKRKLVSLLLSGALVFGLLAGCGGGGNPAETTPAGGETTPAGTETTPAGGETSDEFVITACIASEPQTIDPALNSAVDGAVMTSHMFEGLMRWESTGEE